MNYSRKTVLMLTLTALVMQAPVCAMEERSEQLEQDAKGLLADLREFNRCRKREQGCSQELINRFKVRARNIAIGAAALAGLAVVGFGAGVGYKKYISPKRLYNQALQRYAVAEKDLNAFEKDVLLATAKGDDKAKVFFDNSPKQMKKQMQNSTKVINMMDFMTQATGNETIKEYITSLEDIQ